jgi:hypothetical protein
MGVDWMLVKSLVAAFFICMVSRNMIRLTIDELIKRVKAKL